MQQFVSNPRVTLNLITRDQNVGLKDRRALIVGQIDAGRRAIGSITFAVNPVADSTITLNGTAWTFKASGATGNQVNIGASLALTMAALKTALNASSETQTVKCSYEVNSTKLFVRYKTRGTAGNAFTLAASVATVSGATLTGGAAGAGTAAAGALTTDVPRTDAEINELFGSGSHVAMVARAYRGVNDHTNVDVIGLADNASATYATSKVAIAGTATRDGKCRVTVLSDELHTYSLDVLSGQTATAIITALRSAVALDRYLPFFMFDDEETYAEFTAVNGGPVANAWLIAVDCNIPGLTFTVTGWSGGATNPAFTTLWDNVQNIRYQTIVWPDAYPLATVKSYIDPRKNVENDVKDGRAITFRSETLANAKAEALAANSSEIVVMWNTPTAATNRWLGPHLPEVPDVLAAKFAAARDLRFETDASISAVVTTNEPSDQFGGMDLASLPYFNTPMAGVGNPLKGSGANYPEQLEAEAGGLSVVGVNRSLSGIVMGQVVTTWLNDNAGNPDDTWKYLEWRDTHGAIREYIVLNVRKRFAQYRLTSGDLIPNRAMANEAMIRGYILDLCMQLANASLIVKGQAARQYIQDHMKVTLVLEARKAQIVLKVPMVSQLGNIIGTVQFTFDQGA